MNIYEDEAVRKRLQTAFPSFFVNHNFEIIINPKRNTYFALAGVETERELTAKILEWCSREASKSVYAWSQKYHLDGINRFLGTSFSKSEMDEIYTYLGNAVNHEKTLLFIDSGFDMAVLNDKKNEG